MEAVIHHPATGAAAFSPCSPPESLFSRRITDLPRRSKPDISSFLSPSKPKTKPQNLRLSPQFLPSPSISPSKSPPLDLPLTSEPSIKTDLPSNDYSHLLLLSARYGDVELAKAVHASIFKHEEDTYLSNALIVAYLKLGRIDFAHRVFKNMSSPDVVSYTALISDLAKSNRENEAIELFLEMRGSGIEPNEHSFVALLTACIRLLNLELGLQVHAFVLKLDFLGSTYVVNALMGLYSNCGCLNFVIELFYDMLVRDIVSWNTVISSLVKKGMCDEAFESFRDMLRIDGFRVDYFTISSLLASAAAAGRSGMTEGGEIHACAIKLGFESNLSVNNALIRFYTKRGSVEDVKVLFERMPEKDVFTWTEMITAYMEFGLVDLAVQTFDMMPDRTCESYNALLAGYCRNNKGLRALNLFCDMVEEGIELNDFTLTSAINACGSVMQKSTSEQIHAFILKFGCARNSHVEAALLDMCTWCERMADAENIFLRWPKDWERTIVLTAMICGYARNRQLDQAISLFCQGQSEESFVLDEVVATTMLSICGLLGFCKFGEQLHCFSIKYGLLSDTKMANATISMYAKCGRMEAAIKVFDAMLVHDTVSWNSLLAGHVLHRQGDEALAVWMKMESLGVQPDTVTCLFIISAYRYTGSDLIDCCHRFFSSMESRYQIKPTSEHYANLVGVLGHWGLLKEAEAIILKMPFVPKAAAWRALLDSCRVHQNAAIGKRVAKEILHVEPQDPSMFILKSNLYSASGRWHCSDTVREKMREKGLRKFPGQSWIIHQNRIHSFFARDTSHPQSKDIYSGLQILLLECLKAGYVPDTSFVLHEAEEHQKKDFLFYHSAKLAMTFGLLMTKPGKPVRIFKNILLCGDCHTFFKNVSVVTKREIYVRDSSGFHCFSNGKCSCKDQW
ncbi:unnamed protein product [Coffea canephora]|uniref:DYW domain-containing protein n=1 Tax=Coffea canephora TaxID=49390 RepID=A0A068V494_COFCA|nr:unnamed protein product [Coffea canephora]